MQSLDSDNHFVTLLGYRFERWAFYSFLLLFSYGLVILATFLDYGITVDEPPLYYYGADIIQWYKSGFTYQPIFETRNTWLYGGLVHVFGYVASQVLPLSPYDAYHLCCAIIGFTGVVAAYRIGTLLGGGPAGFLAVLFLILTPRYYGHVFNNPKDIPFAVFYLWSLFWMIRGLGHLPEVPKDVLWKTGLAIGLTLGCRVNGFVLFFYLGLFWGIGYVLLMQQGMAFQNILHIFVKQMVVIVLVAYAVMLPFWPWALLNPITHPFEAIGFFAQFLEPHFSYFHCQYVLNHDVPWYYVSLWLALTMPELVLIGLGLGTLLVVLFVARGNFDIQTVHLQRTALVWSALFPMVYAALMHTPFYDGYRHMLFVVPSLVICAALGVVDFGARLKTVMMRRVFWGGIACLVLWTGAYMVRIHPNQSVYFNHWVAGGIQEASHCFETDYWGNSYKQAVTWIAKNYEWDFSKRKLRLASRFGQLHNVMDTDLFERVEDYESADLYLGTTRFDDHRLTAGEVIHTIDVDETPVLYIIRPDERYKDDPLFAQSAFRRMYLHLHFDGPNANAQEAAFWKTVADQNLAYFVAAAYNNMGLEKHQQRQYEEAVLLYEKALALYPSHLTALYNLGMALYQLERYQAVIDRYDMAFENRAKRILDTDMLRNMFDTLGGCYLHLGQMDAALDAYQKALAYQPDSPNVLNNLASLYIEQEQYVKAYDVLRPLVDAHPDDVKYRMNLAITLTKRDSIGAALKACEAVLRMSPDEVSAYVLMGQIYQAAGQLEWARDAYQEALKRAPNDAEIQAFMRSLSQ